MKSKNIDQIGARTASFDGILFRATHNLVTPSPNIMPTACQNPRQICSDVKVVKFLSEVFIFVTCHLKLFFVNCCPNQVP